MKSSYSELKEDGVRLGEIFRLIALYSMRITCLIRPGLGEVTLSEENFAH